MNGPHGLKLESTKYCFSGAAIMGELCERLTENKLDSQNDWKNVKRYHIRRESIMNKPKSRGFRICSIVLSGSDGPRCGS